MDWWNFPDATGTRRRSGSGFLPGGYQSHFSQVTLTLPVLAFGKVTTTLFPAQNFAGSSDLEAFRDALSRFTAGYFLSHRGRRI